MKDACVDLLQTFPEGSSEQRYFGALYRIVAAIPFEKTDVIGLGLLSFLQQHDFISGDVNTVTEPVAGSRIDDAVFVSCLFAKCGRDSTWWRFEALEREGDDDVVAAAEWWRRRFDSCPLVKEVM